jgi:hypothetical protein
VQISEARDTGMVLSWVRCTENIRVDPKLCKWKGLEFLRMLEQLEMLRGTEVGVWVQAEATVMISSRQIEQIRWILSSYGCKVEDRHLLSILCIWPGTKDVYFSLCHHHPLSTQNLGSKLPNIPYLGSSERP